MCRTDRSNWKRGWLTSKLMVLIISFGSFTNVCKLPSNKMKNILVLFFLGFYCGILAQQSYTIPDAIPASYITNTNNEYKVFINSKKGSYDSLYLNEFVERAIYQKKSSLLNGNVYYNFDQYEDYLNSILKKLLIAADIKSNLNFHAYLKYDENYNARALPDGTILVNIGLMADCVNEDALACILAHEISHIINNDAFNEFKNTFEIDWRRMSDKQYQKVLSQLNYSREVELKADSLGNYIANKAGYNIEDNYANFDYVYRKQLSNLLYLLARNGKSLSSKIRYQPISWQVAHATEIIELNEEEATEGDTTQLKKKRGVKKPKANTSTHPEVIDRLYLLKRQIVEISKNKAPDTFENSRNSDLFNRLQLLAKSETLRILLESNNYYQCMEKAFIYHLNDTSNQSFLYYELEAIRRYLTVDNTQSINGFLNSGLHKMMSRYQSILHNPLYLIPDSIQLASLQAKNYFDHQYEFESYKRAFRFFSEKVDTRKNTELNLTIGLFDKMNAIPEGDSILLEYISNEKSKYSAYAKATLNGTLYSELSKNKREIFICEDVKVYKGIKTKFKREYIESDSATKHLEDDFKAFMSTKSQTSEVYFLQNQTTSDFNLLYHTNTILSSIYFIMTIPQQSIAKSELDESEQDSIADIFIPKRLVPGDHYESYLYALEPETWSFIQSNNIKRISGFDASKLYDSKYYSFNIFNAISKTIIPGLIFLFSKQGNVLHKNTFTFIDFDAIATKRAIKFNYEVAKDKYSRADYVNTVYYKIKYKK